LRVTLRRPVKLEESAAGAHFIRTPPMRNSRLTGPDCTPVHHRWPRHTQTLTQTRTRTHAHTHTCTHTHTHTPTTTHTHTHTHPHTQSTHCCLYVLPKLAQLKRKKHHITHTILSLSLSPSWHFKLFNI